MPTIHIIQSIKIDVYSREHLPPHFHAIYAEHEILIEIKTLKTYGGRLPLKQHKQVIDWAKQEKANAFLFENFYRLNPKLKI
jgi:hypothetical protein